MPTVASLTIAFLLLAAIFVVIERLSPGTRGQRRFRKGWSLDLLYWFFTPLVTRWIARICVAAAAGIVLLALGRSLDREVIARGFGPIARQPAWLQAIEILLLGDLVAYGIHRWFHGRRLWKYHAIHHSSTEVDWLSAVRLHPVNDVVTRVAQVVPFLLLGFSPFVLVAYLPVLTFYAILLLANVNWTFGPLGYVFASPVFHRWHHTKEAEAMDKNFAGMFPFIDLAFGTFYMPKDKLPTEFGVNEAVPEGLVGQLAYPFRRVRDA